MSKLHVKLIDPNKFEPKEGQCDDFACSNNKSIQHCPSLSLNPILSKETIDAIEELGDILKGIHKRMIFEEYEIKNGHITKVKTKDVYEKR